MMAKKFILPAALLPVVLAIACNNAAQHPNAEKSDVMERKVVSQASRLENTSAMDSSTAVAGMDEQPGPQPGDPKKEKAAGNGHSPLTPNPDWDKKIVRNGNLNVEVKNFKAYTARLHEQVKAAGGYIAQEEQNESAYKIENNITIKVPVDRFDETVMQLASDSDKLVSKKITTEDVTMQIVDTRSRLETRRQVRDRYVEMLKQSHSREDIVQTQHEIDNIQAEIEGAAGRIAYLGHAAAYSTIQLNFYQMLDASVQHEVEPSLLRKLSDSFKAGWFWVSSLIVGLVGLWPLLLMGALGFMWWKRRRPLTGRGAVAGNEGGN
ncbi:DUF4349 domain-containing protein [Flavitalea sp. BT771]|uniref:DUF4349 domain-containing protein n=1 Tax=Flavitalea sp. BT771 TaxID=3063329 RepID=UPI0026E34556|nr:DUF4349 domain-containing protein [Flavitalea sp. BT771]MDO6434507.1 DUF4349 domain-containing protein [Flavitalea sp. BT771]MDV6223407.1 DUF4349 domain-containing protein [Flavitalea sp. BT771]